ncbi:GNAT family N-acetyltransferase [Paenibacillus sp. SAF-054]|uniref:GNAT family N-acetyltransferase n=1 Tax=unclassified Paenibacillus TaxID=185978 RepID=UPI003F7D9E76
MFVKKPVSGTDDTFLFQLYASTRQEELESWGWDEQMREQFLSMQWRAQQSSYAATYPDASNLLITVDEKQAGRMMTHRSDGILTLIDLALLPTYRNQGLGTQLIQELQAEAATTSLKLVLHVLPHNPALRLYERLSFRKTGNSGLHIRMEWGPQSASHFN